MMRASDRTETFPSRSGFMARMGRMWRERCREAPARLRLWQAARRLLPAAGGFPGPPPSAARWEALGVDPIVFETLDGLDPHGIRR